MLAVQCRLCELKSLGPALVKSGLLALRLRLMELAAVSAMPKYTNQTQSGISSTLVAETVELSNDNSRLGTWSVWL